MRLKLSIIGASGHGRVAADIAEKNGYDAIEFYDDDPSLRRCGKWPVVGSSALAQEAENELFVAVGDPKIRERLMERYASKRFAVLIHPSAVVAGDASIGAGSIVAAGAVVNPGARLGIGVIVNTCASVDHDCLVEDYAHVSVGAHLGGTVSVGKGSWIGIGASVVNNVRVCGGCMVGAGAVVVRDLETAGTYVGVPARKIR